MEFASRDVGACWELAAAATLLFAVQRRGLPESLQVTRPLRWLMHRHGSLRAGSHGVERHPMLDHPEKGATMRRVRLLAVLVAFVVVAAACGDDDGDQSDPVPEPATVVPTSVAEPAADRRDIEQFSTAAESAQVQLGDRFGWCLEVQVAWNGNLDALRAALAAVVDHNEALVAFNDATDELDRAEAIERIDELEERADDLIRVYHVWASGFYAQIRDLNAGVEGSKGVAYTRAREAFEAAASPQDLTLLSEFEAIRRAQDLDEIAQALPLSPAVKAAIDFTAARSSPSALELPSLGSIGGAGDAVKFAIRDTGYRDHIIAAADAQAETSAYGHLMDIDLATPARAYVEASSDYAAKIRIAFDEANAAFNEAADEPRSAAYDAAREVFEEAVAALKPAEDAYTQAYAAAWDAASDETTAAIRDLRHDTDDAREAARASAWAGLEDAQNAVSSQTEQELRAARDAAAAAADEALATIAREAATEAARASRTEGLVAAVVAEAVVNQFDSDRIKVQTMGLDPGTFVHFVVTAVVVESLIRSNAWAALQQSLTQACQ